MARTYLLFATVRTKKPLQMVIQGVEFASDTVKILFMYRGYEYWTSVDLQDHNMAMSVLIFFGLWLSPEQIAKFEPYIQGLAAIKYGELRTHAAKWSVGKEQAVTEILGRVSVSQRIRPIRIRKRANLFRERLA